jgi:hypothetical protein
VDIHDERLYLLYQSGADADPSGDLPNLVWRRNTDILQVAKAVGNDLTQEEFEWVSDQVRQLEAARANVVDANDNITKRGITKREYNEKIWEIPDSFAQWKKPFIPKRTPSNEPIDDAESSRKPLEHERDAVGSLAQISAIATTKINPELVRKAMGVKDVQESTTVKAPPIVPRERDLGDAPVQPPPVEPRDRIPGIPPVLQAIKRPNINPTEERKSTVEKAMSDAIGDQRGAAEQPALGATAVDKLQTFLDVTGVLDPTPISDGVNTVISLVRAVSDPKNAGTHLTNAATSAVSIIPYLGDVAKAFKYGGKAVDATKAASTAGKAAGHGGGIGGTIQTALGFLGGMGGGMGGGGNAGGGSQGGAGGTGGGGGNAGGGSGGGGGNPGGGGFSWGNGAMWLAAGAFLAGSFRDTLHKFGLFKELVTSPVKYTGDAFDTGKAAIGNVRKIDELTTPFPFGLIRRVTFVDFDPA